MFNGAVACFFHGAHVHAVHLLGRNIKSFAARAQVIGFRRGSRGCCSHGIAVVFDDEDYREFPDAGDVEGFVDLALVSGAVAIIGQRHMVIAAILVGEG